MQSPQIKYLKCFHKVLHCSHYSLLFPSSNNTCICLNRLFNMLFLLGNSLSPYYPRYTVFAFFNHDLNSDIFNISMLIFLGRRDLREGRVLQDPSSFCKQLKTQGCILVLRIQVEKEIK